MEAGDLTFTPPIYAKLVKTDLSSARCAKLACRVGRHIMNSENKKPPEVRIVPFATMEFVLRDVALPQQENSANAERIRTIDGSSAMTRFVTATSRPVPR